MIQISAKRQAMMILTATLLLWTTARSQPVSNVAGDCGGPVCFIYCPAGNVLDAKGCPTCQCKPGGPQLIQIDPVPIAPTACPLCRNFCLYGREILSNGCPSCTCSSVTTAPKLCPQTQCKNLCLYGRVQDSNGCQTCSCQVVTPPPVCTFSLSCYFSCNYEKKSTTCDCACYRQTQNINTW